MVNRWVSWGICAVAIALGGAVSASASSPEAAIAAASRGEYRAALEQLLRSEAEDPARFRANNYDYLVARLLEHRGDFAGATTRYAEVIKRGSNLAEYALWHLALVARAEGNFALERQNLTQLTVRYPSSTLYPGAVERLARSAFESGDYRTAIARWVPIAGSRGTRGRDALARVALARLRLGDPLARRDFDSLLDGSQDDFALAAARGLDQLDAAAKVSTPEIERVRRARVYLFNRDWLGARAHYLVVADTPGSTNRAEALYSLGLTYFRLGEYDAAIDWWEKVASEFPTNPVGIKAYYWVGHAYQRSERYDKAVGRYADFIARYPGDEQVEGAYRNAIDSWRTAGKTAQALAWCDRAEASGQGAALSTFAAFNRAKTLLSTGDAAGALAQFTRLEESYNLGLSGAGMPSSGEIALLRGVCLEMMGRIPEAVSQYLSIPQGRSRYFGNRASLRVIAIGKRPEGKAHVEALLSESLAAARASSRAGNAAAAKAAADRVFRLTDDEAIRSEMLAVLRSSYADIPAYARVPSQQLVPVGRAAVSAASADRTHAALAVELAFLGLFDEAAPELKASGFGTKSPYSLAVYSARGSDAEGALRLGESLVGRLPADYRVELLPRGVAELAYPAPYRAALRKFAIPLDVDPRFELSIARQESTFRPWVKSPAAARGLVQFIPETASRIAASLGIENFDQDDLYDPEVAIRFGARYMADLYALFPQNHYAVAASYNGGEDSVARWLGRAGSKEDPDLFTPEVSFKESKEYVYRVMNNYWAYQALYTRELNPQ